MLLPAGPNVWKVLALSSAATADPPPRTGDASLKRQLQRTTRAQSIRAFALVVPLLAFICVFFLAPIIDMMTRSVYAPMVAESLPRTMAHLEDWDFEALPGEAAFQAIAAELLARDEDGSLGRLALQLNHEIPGARSQIMRTPGGLRRLEQAPDSYREVLTEIHSGWGAPDFWAGLKVVGQPLTLRYYLAAFDRGYDSQGNIVPRPEYEQVYVMLLVRTFWASGLIVALCLLAGYPIAYQIATSPPRVGNLLLILVLLPFWTALLVRTAAWIVLLQQQGVINDVLVSLGLVSDDDRLRIVYNMTGTIVAMVHIMLPFMVLPLYSVMKGISPEYMRAAQSLGATPLHAFFRVYLPLTMPGIGAGCILVFILSIGFYITPALVGGRSGQFLSSFIAYHIQTSLNWGLAAALAGVILICVLALYVIYNRIFGIANMKLG
jgi:putative spermidine/putrescine transport system permease protein